MGREHTLEGGDVLSSLEVADVETAAAVDRVNDTAEILGVDLLGWTKHFPNNL
jgi:hypothetical protein